LELDVVTNEVKISLTKSSDKLGGMNKINLMQRFRYHSTKTRTG